MNSYIKNNVDTIISPQRPTSLDKDICVATAGTKLTMNPKVPENEPPNHNQANRESDTIPKKKPPILSTEAIKNKWKQLTTYGKAKRSAKT